MSDAPIFLAQQHPVSKRHAIVDDDGRACWLYLTAPDSHEPVADAWLCNRVAAPASCDRAAGDPSPDDPPVVPVRYVVDPEPRVPPPVERVRLQWSTDGHSVAAYFDGDLMGFIAYAAGPGHSAHLRASGPYGEPLDADLFSAVFG